MAGTAVRIFPGGSSGRSASGPGRTRCLSFRWPSTPRSSSASCTARRSEHRSSRQAFGFTGFTLTEPGAARPIARSGSDDCSLSAVTSAPQPLLPLDPTPFRSLARGPGANGAGIRALAGHKYCLLVTYKRSGEGVRTPVWFGLGDGKLYVRSEADVAKVKRIRNDQRVRVAPCTVRGKPLGLPAEGRREYSTNRATGRRRRARCRPITGWRKIYEGAGGALGPRPPIWRSRPRDAYAACWRVTEHPPGWPGRRSSARRPSRHGEHAESTLKQHFAFRPDQALAVSSLRSHP